MNANPNKAIVNTMISTCLPFPFALPPPSIMTAEHFQKLAIGQSKLVLLGNDMIYVGRSFDLTPHRVAVTTIAIALEAPFELAIDDMQSFRLLRYAIIPARSFHHLKANGAVAFVYTEAVVEEHRLGQIYESASALAVRLIMQGENQAIVLTYAAQILTLLEICGPILSPRLEAALGATGSSPYDDGNIDRAAAIAGLRTQAFRRRVRTETGMTFGQYRMRARIHAVIRSIARGETLTSAAYDAGFSSSAHLSATVRRLFGLTASTLRRATIQIVTDKNEPKRDENI